VAAFPWDNLITAASTLIAGLGAVGLKTRSDRKDRAAEAEREDAAARAQRQELAYKALVASATELLRTYRQLSGELAVRTTEYHGATRRRDELEREFLHDASEAELASGSNEIRESVGNLRAAARAARAVIDDDPPQAAMAAFEAAIGAFIDVVHP
jgi:hypothetical protein